ncbi:MAG: hypothetical protein M3Q71_02495 [Chloroflexota bacterium]|nr:hypothetical protein [Chloroflexota bacterium]
MSASPSARQPAEARRVVETHVVQDHDLREVEAEINEMLHGLCRDGATIRDVRYVPSGGEVLGYIVFDWPEGKANQG